MAQAQPKPTRQSYRFEGIVTALSSISHIGDSFGINSLLRREKIIQPDGSVEFVPIISGNSLRGILRDAGMGYMLDRIGDPSLTLPQFYFLFSGGSLTKVAGKAIDIEWERKIKSLIPLVAIFGGAAGNHIAPGRLDMGKLIPICTETAHLIPASATVEKSAVQEYALKIDDVSAEVLAFALFGSRDKESLIVDFTIAKQVVTIKLQSGQQIVCHSSDIAESLVESPYAECVEVTAVTIIPRMQSVWESLQEESYVRKDDAKDERMIHRLAESEIKLLAAEAEKKQAVQNTDEDIDKDVGKHQQMRYHVQTYAAGTRLYCEICLNDVTDLEFQAFLSCLVQFSKNPCIGGKRGTGHGKVKVAFDKWMTIDPHIKAGQEIDMPLGTLYHKHLEDHKDEIVSIIKELS